MTRNREWGRGAAPSTDSGLALVAPPRGRLEQQLERLKEQLLASMLATIPNQALVQELRWVANEATALAWTTVCPLLVLPALLEEKARAALRRWERQQRLWAGKTQS